MPRADGRPLVWGGAATPPMAHQETRSGVEMGRGGYTGYAPEEWAAARLWGGPATEIEILEISAGVRMGK